MRRIVIVAAALATGCVATTFRGNPKIETGPSGCRAVCQGWGMELAGMVQMGEYSNGCICQVKGTNVAPRDAAAAALPGVAAVWSEMQSRQAVGAGLAGGMHGVAAGLSF